MKSVRRGTAGFVLFGVGSPIVVEVVESCVRSGEPVVVGISNLDVPSYLPGHLREMKVGAITPDLLSLPCLCPMFTPANRFAAVREAQGIGFRFSRELVDPTAITASDVRFGGGSYVNAGVILGSATTVGENVLINRGASIGHHGRIAEFVSIGPGVIVAGQVTIGRGAMIGAGAIVGPNVNIGAHAVVGAGAVVLADVPPHRKVFGAPAAIVGKPLDGFDT